MTVVFYCGQIYSLLFLSQVLKVDPQSANLLIAAALVIGSPFYIASGWLADKIGPKSVLLAGCVLAAASYFPIFHAITHYANPAIEEAAERAPVTVLADPKACSVQFDLLGNKRFTKSCDVAKSALAHAGVPYANEAAPAGSVALVRIGTATMSAVRVQAFEGSALNTADFKAADAAFVATLNGALKSAGYPQSADPKRINYPMVFLLLLVLVLYLAIAYAPVAALLVDMFPARIRYTSVSVAYHMAVGSFGGFLPTVAFAVVAITGNIYAGLWYPVLVALGSALIGAVFLKRKETTLAPAQVPAAG
jgi:nitrate/nitrite transporter NarK